jgi:outer membrane murein-binding lipoprotein Lpp
VVDEPEIGRQLERQAEEFRQLQAVVTQLARTQAAQATAGSGSDFLTRWSPWIGIAALAATMGGIWLAGLFSTNTRVDQIYPTILQQTKDIAQQTADISAFKGELKTASDKMTTVSAQNEELFKSIRGLTEAQGGLIAKQDALFSNVADIKSSVTNLVSDVSAQHDQLIRIDDKLGKPSPGVPQKKTELLQGGYVFASKEYTSALKDTFGAGVDIVPLDNRSTDSFARAFAKAAEASGKPNIFYMFTKDAGLADSLKGTLGAK